MNHLAIDLGGRESQICVRGPKGDLLEERRYATVRLGTYLRRWPKSRGIVETCSEAFAVADTAHEHGHEVRVVPTTLVRTLGVGARRIKTDERDARVLSEVSCRIDLPSVHIPSATAREWKTLTGMRRCLVEARTLLINCVRGWLRTRVQRIRSGSVTTFCQRVRAKLLKTPEGIPGYVERQLVSIEALSQQIKDADREIAEIAGRHPVTQRLMTVPGVGAITALHFVAAIDQVTRFANAHTLESYLGLTPGENSSSEHKQRTSITKAGPPQVRRMLIQASWSIWRARPNDPLGRWGRQVAERRGRPVAIVGMARKLAGMLYAIWRDGSTYDPLLACPRAVLLSHPPLAVLGTRAKACQRW